MSPRKITPQLIDEAKRGFDFTDNRWEGEEYVSNAMMMRAFLQTQHGKVGVHVGEAKRWVSGKHIEYKYYKIFFEHPEDRDLYAWWMPSRDKWAMTPHDPNKATWFEYQSAA